MVTPVVPVNSALRYNLTGVLTKLNWFKVGLVLVNTQSSNSRGGCFVTIIVF